MQGHYLWGNQKVPRKAGDEDHRRVKAGLRVDRSRGETGWGQAVLQNSSKGSTVQEDRGLYSQGCQLTLSSTGMAGCGGEAWARAKKQVTGQWGQMEVRTGWVWVH